MQIETTKRYPHLLGMALIKKKKKKKWKEASVGQDVEKLEASYITNGNINWYSHF